eukprot:g23.t1
MKREIGKLLSEGKNEYAWIRVEGVIRETNLLAAYEILELYLELIAVRAALLEKQRTCPKDMVEAISTLMYAAPRVSDLPELIDVRKSLSTKFGAELGVEGARSLNGEEPPNWQVNLRLRQYLSVEAPDSEDKITMISSIAEQQSINFNMEEYAQSVMVTLDSIVQPPKAPVPAPAPMSHQTYPQIYSGSNLPPTVVMPPPIGNLEPPKDSPVLPPARPSFRVPFQGPSTGLYTDAQMKIMGTTVMDEPTVEDSPPPVTKMPEFPRTESELQKRYDEVPGPPTKDHLSIDDELPTAPPVEDKESEKDMEFDGDDDLSRRLDDLRKR